MKYKQMSNEKLLDDLSKKVINESMGSEVFDTVSFHTCNTLHRPIVRSIKRSVLSYMWDQL
jgi:hypothetical protein